MKNQSYFKTCVKVQANAKNVNQSDDAPILYLKLRNDGCSKKKAITFCSKNRCKNDTTKLVDGPATCRTLVPTFDKQQIQHQGWQITGSPSFKLKYPYITNTQQILISDKEDDNMIKQLSQKEEIIKDSYKNKIKNMQQYFNDIEKKFNITNLPLQERQTRINLFTHNQREKQAGPQNYIQIYKDLRVTEVVNEFFQQQQQEQKPSLIQELDGFPSIRDKFKEKVRTEYRTNTYMYMMNQQQNEQNSPAVTSKDLNSPTKRSVKNSLENSRHTNSPLSPLKKRESIDHNSERQISLNIIKENSRPAEESKPISQFDAKAKWSLVRSQKKCFTQNINLSHKVRSSSNSINKIKGNNTSGQKHTHFKSEIPQEIIENEQSDQDNQEHEHKAANKQITFNMHSDESQDNHDQQQGNYRQRKFIQPIKIDSIKQKQLNQQNQEMIQVKDSLNLHNKQTSCQTLASTQYTQSCAVLPTFASQQAYNLSDRVYLDQEQEQQQQQTKSTLNLRNNNRGNTYTDRYSPKPENIEQKKFSYKINNWLSNYLNKQQNYFENKDNLCQISDRAIQQMQSRFDLDKQKFLLRIKKNRKSPPNKKKPSRSCNTGLTSRQTSRSIINRNILSN